MGLDDEDRQFESFIQSIPLGLHFFRMEDDGRLVFKRSNRAADRILGVDPRELTDAAIEEAFPGIVGTDLRDRYLDVLNTGEGWCAERVEYQDERVSGAFSLHAFRLGPDTLVVAFEDISERKAADLALTRAEARFRATFEHAPVGMATVAPDGRFLHVNSALCVTLGRSEQQLLGASLRSVTHPDEPLTAVEGLASGEHVRSHTMEARYVDASGATVLGQTHTQAVHDEQGQIDFFVLQIRDITERRRALRDLQETRRQFEAMVSNMLGVKYRANPDWTADFMGPVQDLTGYSVEDLKTMPEGWLQVVHPDDRDRVVSESAILRERPTSVVQEYRILTADGSTRWVEDRKSSLFTDKNEALHLFASAQGRRDTVRKSGGGVARGVNMTDPWRS